MGIDELRERIFKERKFLRGARDWPGGIPDAGPGARATRPRAARPSATKVGADGVAGEAAHDRPVRALGRKRTSCAASPTARSARSRTRASATSPPSSSARLADIQRDFDLDIRITNRQNFALRDLARSRPPCALRPAERDRHGRAGRRARPRRRRAARAPTRATSRSRSRAGSPPRSATRSKKPASPRCRGVRVNISGCTNSCGQHHISDIGFFGLERRAHGRAAPGYQMLLGGHLGDIEVEFGDKATKIPAKTAPEAVVRVVAASTRSAQPGETFQTWLARSGGAKGVGDDARRSSTTSPPPTSAPSSTSTTTRPVPTSPKSATGSARRHERRSDSDRRSHRPLVDVDLGELAAVSAELEHKPASAAIKWAWERFGTDIVLAASFQDCVLIDVAAQRGARHRGRVPRHAVPLRRDALVRRAGP